MTAREAPLYYVRAVLDGVTSPGVRLTSINERVLSMKFEDAERKADKLSLTIDNYDLAMFDEPAFKKGMLLDIQWGYVGNMAPARRVVVQSIKGGLSLTVEALAESILLNKIVKATSHVNVRRSDVVRAIARAAGYADENIDIEETPTVYPEIAQARMTDAQMVKRLGDLEGFEFYVDHTGFHWHARRTAQPAARVLRWFTDRTGEIQTFSIENDITAKKAKRRRRGRDPVERTEIDAEASESTDENAESLGDVVDILDPETATFRRAEITEADRRTVSEDVAPTTAQDGDTAAREARGEHRSTKTAAVQLKLTIIGDPLIQAKQVVKIEGLGQRVSGLYYIKTVTNTIDSGGFKQELDCISDGSGGHARRSRLGDLELPTRGVPSQGTPNVARDVETALEHGALQEQQVLDPESGRYTTVYVNNQGRTVAHRTRGGRVVAED